MKLSAEPAIAPTTSMLPRRLKNFPDLLAQIESQQQSLDFLPGLEAFPRRSRRCFRGRSYRPASCT